MYLLPFLLKLSPLNFFVHLTSQTALAMKLFEQDGLLDNLRGYIQTQIELAKLDAQEQIEQVIKRLVIVLAWMLLGSTIILFMLIALALYLNHALASSYAGFLIVAGIGMVIALILVGVWRYLTPQKKPTSELDLQG